jgi:hypothetical protein
LEKLVKFYNPEYLDHETGSSTTTFFEILQKWHFLAHFRSHSENECVSGATTRGIFVLNLPNSSLDIPRRLVRDDLAVSILRSCCLIALRPALFQSAAKVW